VADDNDRFLGTPMKTGRGTSWGRLVAVALMLGAGREGLGQEVKPWVTLKGHEDGVNSLAFSPVGRTLASGSLDSTVRFWEVMTGRKRAVLKHPGGVQALAFAPNGKLLASGDFVGEVRLWDPVGNARGSLKSPHAAILCLSFSPDGLVLAGGGRHRGTTGTLRLWDVCTRKELLALPGLTAGVTSVSFSVDGRMLAGGDFGGVVTVWETASGRVRAALKGHRGCVRCVAFIPGGLLASGGDDGTVRLWDLRAGRQWAALKGHTGSVFGLSVAGKMLVSAGQDRTVRLRDLPSGKGLLTLSQADPIYSVEFGPRGRLLATGDAKGTIRLWSVPKLLAQKGKK
jgi:WD40 repeat protein